MKKALIVAIIISNVTLSVPLRAESLDLPVISRPAILQEGTQRDLTPAQIAELLPWAKNSKIFLTDLLDNIQTLAPADKVDRLIDGITSVVGESAPKNTELLMRYVLNRGIVLNDLLLKEVEPNSVGLVDAQLRVLRASVEMAIQYYEKDLAVLSKKSNNSFAEFGLNYFSFLSELNKSVFDASAQYAIQKTALEFLQWDLYRDLNNTIYAPQIVKINNALKIFTDKKKSDAQSIAYIRQMKSISNQINIQELLNNILLAEAKNERERQAILRQIALDEQARLEAIKRQNTSTNTTSPAVTYEVIGVDDRVINEGKVGTVMEVFASGDFNVKPDGGYSYERAVWTRASVSKSVKCYKQFCATDRVIKNGKKVGTVIEVFSNGQLSVRPDGGSTYEREIWPASSLGKGIGCTPKNICVNARINQGSSAATVIEVFDNNYLSVHPDGEYKYSRSIWTAQ